MSPNRETEAMRDGSDAVSDWPLLNALHNSAGGATWVSLHHGGGVGMGYSQRAGRIIIVSSFGGVRASVGSGPYTITKHAIQAFGTALRAELKAFGVDVCLVNPGPYATGFNDRMANDPGPWFDRKSAAPEDVAVMDQLVQRITVGQLDPADVVRRSVELVEAESTEPVSSFRPTSSSG